MIANVYDREVVVIANVYDRKNLQLGYNNHQRLYNIQSDHHNPINNKIGEMVKKEIKRL